MKGLLHFPVHKSNKRLLHPNVFIFKACHVPLLMYCNEICEIIIYIYAYISFLDFISFVSLSFLDLVNYFHIFFH